MNVIAEKERILVVDDSPATVEVLQRNLASRGHPVITVGSVAEAIATLAATPVDLVITDLKMPGGSGLDLVRHVRERCPDSEVMMITGYATVESAVEAVKSGAEEYLAKPFTAEELAAAVERALGKLRLRRAGGPTREPGGPLYGIAGVSPAVGRIRDQIARAAHSLVPVLLVGEPGTGRELVARAIHYTSNRFEGPFVVASCGRIPADRFEREVLGGSSLARAAVGGTLFLAEVHTLAPEAQARLVDAIGSLRDVRVMASCLPDIGARAANRRFRPELLAHLEASRIELPPLRERREDVEPLVRFFLEKAARPVGRVPQPVEDDALRLLSAHDWPGNVEELERFLAQVDGDRLGLEALPSWLRPGPFGGNDLLRPLAAWETDYIRAVLASVNGNKTRAAGILGIDRKTLRQKLR